MLSWEKPEQQQMSGSKSSASFWSRFEMSNNLQMETSGSWMHEEFREGDRNHC